MFTGVTSRWRTKNKKVGKPHNYNLESRVHRFGKSATHCKKAIYKFTKKATLCPEEGWRSQEWRNPYGPCD